LAADEGTLTGVAGFWLDIFPGGFEMRELEVRGMLPKCKAARGLALWSFACLYEQQQQLAGLLRKASSA
jgi:hypothetical protein